VTGDQPAEQVAARLDFVAQENVLHEQLRAVTAEIAAARQHGLSAEQWRTGLAHLVNVCDALALFRTRWRELVGPDA
jgi:hypothetical protein